MKRSTKKNLVQIGALVLAVCLILGISLFFQQWWNNRPGAEPKDVAISVMVADNTTEILPYSVCEPGLPCTPSEPPVVKVKANDHIELKLPREIYDHDWTLLTIYDDPSANDQFRYGSYEQESASVAVTSDIENARLGVIEIHSVMIGHDAKGQETPMTVVWSIGVEVADS